METQYSGDNILLIFPDGTSPALLTALIGGLPLNRVHELNFRPAEVQFDITYDSARALMPSYTNPDGQSADEKYLETIQFGRKELQKLRDNPDTIINVKDLEYEKILKEEEKKAALLEQSKAAAKMEEDRIRAAKIEADRVAKEKKRNEIRTLEKKEKEWKTLRTSDERSQTNDISGGNEGNEYRLTSALTAVAAITAIAVASVVDNDTPEEINLTQDKEQKPTIAKPSREANEKTNNNAKEYNSFNYDIEIDLNSTQTAASNTTEIKFNDKGNELKIENEQQQFESKIHQDYFKRPVNVTGTLYDDNGLDFDTPENRAKEAMEAYMNQDDGGDAWLQMLSEIAESDSDGDDE